MKIQQLINKKKREKKAKAIKQTALTAALGLTAGATAGILLAPKSGKETRNDISTKGAEIKNNIVTKSTDMKENISEKVSKRKSDINEAKEKISNYLAKKKKSKCEEEVTELVEESMEKTEVDTEGENQCI